jgi:hypothetical protein
MVIVAEGNAPGSEIRLDRPVRATQIPAPLIRLPLQGGSIFVGHFSGGRCLRLTLLCFCIAYSNALLSQKRNINSIAGFVAVSHRRECGNHRARIVPSG